MARKKNYRIASPVVGNPEGPSKKSIEKITTLYLKSDPELVEAVERVIAENGYKTAPEAVRHLMYVAIAATPLDGEIRAAIRSIKSQMTQYLTIKFWALLKEVLSEYERDWSAINAQSIVDAEIVKNRIKDEGENTHV